MARSQFGDINKEEKNKEEKFDLRFNHPFTIAFENEG